MNTVMRGLAQFTQKSEPQLMLSSALAHILNLMIKRTLEFLVYLKETIRYFFDIFVTS